MKMRHRIWPSIVFGVIFTLLMVAAPLSFAGFPPPGSHFTGPAVRGTFVFSETEDGVLTLDFNGTCGSGDVSTGVVVVDGFELYEVTEEALLDNVLPTDLFGLSTLDCEPNSGATPDGLLVIKIQSFVEVGNIKTADVVMLWVVP